MDYIKNPVAILRVCVSKRLLLLYSLVMLLIMSVVASLCNWLGVELILVGWIDCTQLLLFVQNLAFIVYSPFPSSITEYSILSGVKQGQLYNLWFSPHEKSRLCCP